MNRDARPRAISRAGQPASLPATPNRAGACCAAASSCSTTAGCSCPTAAVAAGPQVSAGEVRGCWGRWWTRAWCSSAGDLDGARRHLAESLGIARELNARSDIVYETFNLGLAEYLGGSSGAAEVLFAESFDLARRMG